MLVLGATLLSREEGRGMVMATKNRAARIASGQSYYFLVTSNNSLRSRRLVIRNSQGHVNKDAEIEKHLKKIPSCQPWIKDNSPAKDSLERGLQQAAEGRGRHLGSFAQFADLEIED